MLGDIYTDANINNGLLAVQTPQEAVISIPYGELFDKNVEKIFSKLMDENESQEIKDLHLKQLIKMNVELNATYSFKGKNPIANHVINFAFTDGIPYYIDPTLNYIFRKVYSEKELLFNELGYPLKTCEKESDYNSKKKIREINSLSIKPIVSFETNNSLINKTTQLCESNLDLIECFYRNNSEKYDEITDKVQKIKVKMK